MQQILERHPAAKIEVFAVWEPMLTTDWQSPTSGVLARLKDVRARQYWDPRHLVAQRLAADAREYLKASRERGDIYISGKTEEHEPGAVSLGLIVTDTDTAFILIGAEQE